MIELKPERLFLYPIKGCGGVDERALLVDPAHGVRFDRRYAFAIDTPPPAGDGAFRRKQNFLNGMRWPQMARLKARLEVVADRAANEAGGSTPAESAEGGREPPRLSATLGELRRAEAEGDALVPLEAPLMTAAAQELVGDVAAPRLVTTTGGGFADRDAPYVSIINLDTLDAFAAFVGDPAVAEPARWRCNLYVRAGVGAEYGWARDGATLAIGPARLRVDKLLGRCAMITAEPQLGRKDHPQLVQTLRAFEEAHGFEHPEERAPVMGVLAIPAAASYISLDGRPPFSA